MREIMQVPGLTGLFKNGCRTGNISPGKIQASEERFTGTQNITRIYKLPRQLDALFPVLLGSLQVVPFVEYAGQPKMREPGNRYG